MKKRKLAPHVRAFAEALQDSLEKLRGPMGPQGPTGPMGAPGADPSEMADIRKRLATLETEVARLCVLGGQES